MAPSFLIPASESIGLRRAGGIAMLLLLAMAAPGGASPIGYLWVPNFEADNVSVINTETRVIEQTVYVGDGPAGVAVGAEYVYVTHRHTPYLYRIAKPPSGPCLRDSIDLSSEVAFGIGVAVDAEGFVYIVGRANIYAGSTDLARIVKINPSGNIIDAADLQSVHGDSHGDLYSMQVIGIGISPAGVAYIPWSRGWNIHTGIILLNTDDLTFTDHEFNPMTYGYLAPGVGIDAEGNGWMTSRRQSLQRVIRVTPAGEFQFTPNPCGASAAGGVTVDALGGVWGGKYDGTEGIYRLEEGPPEEWVCLEAPGYSEGFAVGRQGYVWVAFGEEGTVRRYHPAGVPAGDSISVGDTPVGFGDMTGSECVFTPGIPSGIEASRVPGGGLRLFPCTPNPAAAGTTVRLLLDVPRRVTVGVHDPTGRRVRTLVARELTAGHHALRWNGRDDEGTPVSSGLYLCRVTAGRETGHESVVILR